MSTEGAHGLRGFDLTERGIANPREPRPVKPSARRDGALPVAAYVATQAPCSSTPWTPVESPSSRAGVHERPRMPLDGLMPSPIPGTRAAGYVGAVGDRTIATAVGGPAAGPRILVQTSARVRDLRARLQKAPGE